MSSVFLRWVSLFRIHYTPLWSPRVNSIIEAYDTALASFESDWKTLTLTLGEESFSNPLSHTIPTEIKSSRRPTKSRTRVFAWGGPV
ncbi:hypothetical protein NPIL_180821 [Nephila pilipes]|uniref:Uncharacterized protein n=1 Tax=Nephila pilipes TaxID=299642 RepID=A0A8X6TBS8_NEPPI|nr:hypothetical protein NPIL_180821 [Nephila pilipes]